MFVTGSRICSAKISRIDYSVKTWGEKRAVIALAQTRGHSERKFGIIEKITLNVTFSTDVDSLAFRKINDVIVEGLYKLGLSKESKTHSLIKLSTILWYSPKNQHKRG